MSYKNILIVAHQPSTIILYDMVIPYFTRKICKALVILRTQLLTACLLVKFY